jgi:hypothetical protein
MTENSKRLVIGRFWGSGIRLEIGGVEATILLQRSPGHGGDPIRLVIEAPDSVRVSRIEPRDDCGRRKPQTSTPPAPLGPRVRRSLEEWETRKKRLGRG